MITVFGCPVNSDYLEMLLKSAGYDPADESGVVKIVATDDGKVTVHWPSGGTSELVNASSSMTFLSLPDTPDSYSGSETFYVKVNSAGTDLVFVSGGGTETDELVKTSSADSTAGYLGDKIDANTLAVDTASQTIKVKGGIFASAGHTHSWGDVSKSGSKLSDLGDVPAYQAGKVLGVDSSGTTLQWVANSGGGGTAGATTYLELDDTPSSYSGQAGKVPVVKSDESGLDWFDAASAGHTHDDRYYTETEADSLFSPALEVDYYVDYVSGSDTNDGSSSSPFKTLQQAFSMIPFGGVGNIHLLSDVTITSSATLENKSVRLGYPYAGGKTITFQSSIFLRNASIAVDNCTLDIQAEKAFYADRGISFIGLGGYYGITVNFYNGSDSRYLIMRNYTTDYYQDSPIVTFVSMIRVQVYVTDSAGQQCYMYKHKTSDWGSVLLVQTPKSCSFDSLVSQNIPVISTSDEKVAVDSSSTPDYLGNLIAGSLEISSGKAQLENDSSSPGAWKVYGTNGSGTRGWYDMETPKYTKLIAYNTDGRPEYVGEADPGTATSASSWRIKKLTYDTDGNITAVKWADGNSNFDNVWDNRTSYSYS